MRTQMGGGSSGEVMKTRGAISKSACTEMGSGEKRAGRGRWRKSLVQAIKVLFCLFTSTDSASRIHLHLASIHLLKLKKRHQPLHCEIENVVVLPNIMSASHYLHH